MDETIKYAVDGLRAGRGIDFFVSAGGRFGNVRTLIIPSAAFADGNKPEILIVAGDVAYMWDGATWISPMKLVGHGFDLPVAKRICQFLEALKHAARAPEQITPPVPLTLVESTEPEKPAMQPVASEDTTPPKRKKPNPKKKKA